MARRCAEFEHFKSMAGEIDIVDGLRALVAAVEHAGAKSVGGILRAKRDILRPQGDAHFVAGREAMQKPGLETISAANIDHAVCSVAFKEEPADFVSRAGVFCSNQFGWPIIEF